MLILFSLIISIVFYYCIYCIFYYNVCVCYFVLIKRVHIYDYEIGYQ